MCAAPSCGQRWYFRDREREPECRRGVGAKVSDPTISHGLALNNCLEDYYFGGYAWESFLISATTAISFSLLLSR